MQKEVFKDIPGYEGIYQVSNLGKVKSLSRLLTNGRSSHISKEKILKNRIDTRGYYSVFLCNNNISKNKTVHQLIAICFLNHKPDGTNKIVVDHINNNKLDNRLENLQLITNRENTSKGKLLLKKASKYTGVSWNKSRNKWCSSIQINKKRKNLGYFKCETKAYLSYLKNIKELNNGK